MACDLPIDTRARSAKCAPAFAMGLLVHRKGTTCAVVASADAGLCSFSPRRQSAERENVRTQKVLRSGGLHECEDRPRKRECRFHGTFQVTASARTAARGRDGEGP